MGCERSLLLALIAEGLGHGCLGRARDRRLSVSGSTLETRLVNAVAASEKIGETLPMACQDWAATKAAYRFFSNPRVDESIILAGHFAATAARMSAASGADSHSARHDRVQLSARAARGNRQDPYSAKCPDW